jgi:RNA polymerase sigma factor (sigma-70 family)
MTTKYHTRPRRAMVAMLLGTALAATAAPVGAAEQASPRAVQDISRYCSVCWRNARLPVDCWGDCTQDVFQRLLERVPAAGWSQVFAAEGAERVEFLRAIDTVKKRVQRDRQRWGRMHDEPPDRRAADEGALRETRELLGQAIERTLSPRQQQIMERTRDGWSVAEIAGELGMSAARISDEKYKALHKLRAHFGAV